MKTRGSGRARSFRSVCVLWCPPRWPRHGRRQDLYEGLPDYVRFVNTMREVADRVTSGDRLPLPPLTSSSSPLLNGSTAGGDVPGTVNENEVKADSGAPQWTPGYAQQDRLAKMINRCFQTAPEERPHMSKILFHLRRDAPRGGDEGVGNAPPVEGLDGIHTRRRAPHERCICRESQSEGWCGASGVDPGRIKSRVRVTTRGTRPKSWRQHRERVPRITPRRRGCCKCPFELWCCCLPPRALCGAFSEIGPCSLLLSVAAVQVFVMRWSSS